MHECMKYGLYYTFKYLLNAQALLLKSLLHVTPNIYCSTVIILWPKPLLMNDSPVGVTPRSFLPKVWGTPPGVNDSLCACLFVPVWNTACKKNAQALLEITFACNTKDILFYW